MVVVEEKTNNPFHAHTRPECCSGRVCFLLSVEGLAPYHCPMLSFLTRVGEYVILELRREAMARAGL